MRSTTRVVCAGETPSGSFQHFFRWALNAVFSSSARLAVVIASVSKPFSGAFGRSSNAGILAGSKIEGAGRGSGLRAGVCAASAACWLTSGGLAWAASGQGTASSGSGFHGADLSSLGCSGGGLTSSGPTRSTSIDPIDGMSNSFGVPTSANTTSTMWVKTEIAMPAARMAGFYGTGAYDPRAINHFAADRAAAYGDPRTTPSLKNTRYGVVPLALPSRERHRPLVHRVPPCAGTASNSTLL